LKTRDHIFGELPSVDEFLEPAEGQQVGESFEGGDEAIIAVVRQEMVLEYSIRRTRIRLVLSTRHLLYIHTHLQSDSQVSSL
jgi:hypothetical protein